MSYSLNLNSLIRWCVGGMPDRAASRAVAAIYDAVIDEKRRGVALQAVADCIGVAGAGYLVVDKYSDRTHVSFSPNALRGRCAEYESHYAAIDPYRAARQRAPTGDWVRVTEMFPERFLARNEWYNDFIVAGGLRDVLGGKLYESATHIFLIGLHREIGDSGPFPRDYAALAELSGTLAQAARLHAGLLDAGMNAALDQEAVDRMSTGVVFVDEDARIVRLNRVAEGLLQRADGLVAHGGRLTARSLSEAAGLARLIQLATIRPPSAGCMLIQWADEKPHYIVRVAPIGVALEQFDQPMAMVSIVSPVEVAPLCEDVAALYGLSPAESRVALGLARGARVTDIAAASGVRISTVRSQLRAILRKLGMERQSDIVRLVLSVPASNEGAATLMSHEDR